MADSYEAKLQRLIDASEQARDNAARGAALATEIGAHDLALDLKRLAAMYDGLVSSTKAQLESPADEPPATPEAGPAG